MKVKVKFFTLFRLEYGISELELTFDKEEITVKELLDTIDKKTNKDISKKLFGDNERLKTSAIILINGKNIFHLNGLDTNIGDGDTVSIFPPGGGG